MDYRVPVAVRLRVDTDGTVQPKTIEWPDGREFDIVRVGGRTRTVDRESGEIGWCYEVTLSLMKRADSIDLDPSGTSTATRAIGK